MAAWQKALKELSKRNISSREEYDQLIAEMSGIKSDRACGIVCTTTLEDALRRFVIGEMVPLSVTQREQLFERDAPLSSFSKLIRLSYAFGLIDEEVRRNFDYIREIRNAFAHCVSPIGFNTPEISSVCALLSQSNMFYEVVKERDLEGHFERRKDEPKMLFLRTYGYLMFLLQNWDHDGRAPRPITFVLRK